jgi:FtsZ-binding cell division protein ZapB
MPDEAEPVESIPDPELMFGSGVSQAEAEAIEEFVPPALGPLFEESVPPPVAVTPEAPPVLDTPRIEVQSFPAEKIDALAEDLETLSAKLSRITDAIALLQKTVSDLKGDIASVKNDLAHAMEKKAEGPELKDHKEFKELRREQKDTAGMIRDILGLLGRLKEKKRWFRF